MERRTLLIIASSTVLVSGVGYIIYSKFRNKKEINEIHAKLDGKEGTYGSIEDFADVFTGSTYVADMKAKHKNLILLRDNYVTTFRNSLHKSIRGLGTDEEGIKEVFRKLKDRVHIAQVAASYQKHFGENLLTAIKGEMDADDKEMKELRDIMINKLAYRVSK